MDKKRGESLKAPVRIRAAFLYQLVVGSGIICTACAQDLATAAGSGGYVKDCQPCQFMIGDNIPPYQFFFVLESNDGSRLIREVVVKQAPDANMLQTLTIDNMYVVLLNDEFFFETKDINFDGYNDLSLIIEQGVVNSYVKYWLFDSDTRRFNYLDELPVLTVDKSTKTLSSYERGGHGGMIFERKKYQFENGGLQVIRLETQEWIEEKQAYLNTVRILKEGRLSVIEEKTVHPPN